MASVSVAVGLIVEAIRLGIVFLLGSTGEIITEKSGHLNLGTPGTMCIGAIGGCLAAYYTAGAGAFVCILCSIICALLFGALAGALYGLFTISMRCNQNVTGLVITTFGAGLLGVFSAIMSKAAQGTGEVGGLLAGPSLYFTKSLFGKVGSDWFSQIFLSHGVLVYVGIIIAIIVAIVLKKTRVGLSLTAVGESPATADAAGINVTRYKYGACIVGGAIAGLGGAFYYLNLTRGSIEPGVIDAMGWIAVALVIFCLWRPGWSILGSFVFGLLYIMPNYIKGVEMAEKELMEIIPYAVTAVVLIVISFFNKKETQPPSSLGLSYFREER